MERIKFKCDRSCWLPLLLIVTGTILSVEIFSFLCPTVHLASDITIWARAHWWILANLLFVAGLAGIDYTSDVKRGWLRALLGVAGLVLLFQLFPDLWYGIPVALAWTRRGIVAVVDVREWSRATWMVANVVVLMAVWFSNRFEVNLNFKHASQARHKRLAARRAETELIRHIDTSCEMRERLDARKAQATV